MKLKCLLAATIICLTFIGGILVGRNAKNYKSAQDTDYSEKGGTYKFINPLLYCKDQNLDTTTVSNIQDQVESYIDQRKSDGDIIDASFYFKDLNGGPWAIVNPSFRSLPASLMKVPVAISIYKHAEEDPEFLNKKITFIQGADLNATQYFRPPEEMVPKKIYTVKELVDYMLEYSDNSALYQLVNLLSNDELQKLYSDLGIEIPKEGGQGYTISAKTYASLFRVLYSSTYLDHEESDYLLSILSQSTFKQGLAAGLPKDMVAAHKFGEAESDDGIRQLHDCGIVYMPEHPYLICVMSKGNNFDLLAGLINNISKIVYKSLQQ